MSDLLKINVNEHTEKKSNLTYLSWAWAWAEVLKIDPKATWEAHEFPYSSGPDWPANHMPCMFLPDESAMVKVSVTIKDDKKTCLLPVMDHRNKAIKQPDAFQINTAIMRCLAKAIGMHGLGLYIYAGEDLPEGETQSEKVEAPNKRTSEDAFNDLPESRKATIREYVTELGFFTEAENYAAAYEKLQEFQLDDDDKLALWFQLDSKTRSAFKRIGASKGH